MLLTPIDVCPKMPCIMANPQTMQWRVSATWAVGKKAKTRHLPHFKHLIPYDSAMQQEMEVQNPQKTMGDQGGFQGAGSAASRSTDGLCGMHSVRIAAQLAPAAAAGC